MGTGAGSRAAGTPYRSNRLEKSRGGGGRFGADALEGQCETLIERLLKIAVAPESIRKNSLPLRRASVRNARHKIGTLLRCNPSLRIRSDELFTDTWPVGRNDALATLDLEDKTIPEAPLFTFDQAVDDGFELEMLRQLE